MKPIHLFVETSNFKAILEQESGENRLNPYFKETAQTILAMFGL
jgi:hypothetical protein